MSKSNNEKAKSNKKLYAEAKENEAGIFVDVNGTADILPAGPRWTPEQLDAIERRGENLLVAAAAGSGKTSVMVERVRRIVCDEEIPVEDILVVTFTKAAAAEMKDRIRRALIDALDAEDPNSERSKKLRAQIRNLPLAQISTFHAFGMSVIKRFFYLTDIDPGTRIAEETECAILKEEALDELIEEEFEKYDPAFIEFMDNYSGDRSDYQVRLIILEAAKKIFAMPHGMAWADARIAEMENIREDFGASTFWHALKEDIEIKLASAIDLTGKAVQILEDAGIEDKAEQLRAYEVNRYEEALSLFKSWECGNREKPDGEVDKKEASDSSPLSAEDIMLSAKEILSANVPNLNAPKGELAAVYKEIQQSIKLVRDEAKKIVRDGIVKPYFANDISDALFEVELDAVPLRELMRLTKRFDEIYSEKKRDAGMMDFNDIEHYALQILEHDEASEYYKNKLKYIFIDEYQDTNLMQEAIIDCIKGDDNLFMVGDIKQSIYKFRLAESSIFQNKYDRFKSGTEEKADVIDLNRNHRSKSPIIDFINSIFRPLMSGYDEDAELYCGDEYDGELLREPEIHVVMAEETIEEHGAAEASLDGTSKETSNDNSNVPSSVTADTGGESDDSPESWDKVYLEAKHVARIIKENLGKEFFDSKAKPKHARPLEKRDIVVLMRSVSSYASLYSQALQEEGIDAYLEGDDGYFDTLEISAFINLLAVIDNIRQDIPLISVLHSGIFGFTSKELAEIRLLCRQGSFSEAFIGLAKAGMDELRASPGKFTENTCELAENSGGESVGTDGDDVTDYNAETPAEKGGAISKDEKEKLLSKCAAVLDKISYWQNLSLTMPLDRYVWRLMLESNCYVSMGALPRGGARQANLRALCDMAEKYAAERQATLYGFLNYVSAVKSGNVRIPEVSALGEGDDVVRIMTIHKSKGLEFPMVIVSGLGTSKKYARGNTFRMHKDIGLSLTLKSGKEHWQKDILIKDIITSRTKQEEIDEEIRVLYVALTRARDILYLVGYEDKDISDFAANGTISHSQYMQMILPGNAYKVFYVNADDGANPSDDALANNDISIHEITAEKRDAILAQLNYEYPFEKARKLKSKYSVSELNKESKGEAEKKSKGASTKESKSELSKYQNTDADTNARKKSFFVFASNEDEGGMLTEMSAAERGTVYHRVLEKLDFAKALDPSYIDSKVAYMVDKNIISEEELASVDIGKIKSFFDSEIGKRASAAASNGMLEKERPFTLMINKDGQDVLVQGIIDCYFRVADGGELRTVLLDYKSNRIRGGVPRQEEIRRISDMYRTQLAVYRLALEEAGLRPVDEVYLYLLDIGEAIAVD
ncbi:MAG: UvrD-helicase domain-containing protein [Firmicutes bacterium]|nr:UvrD-helicase domain-containing protein [Bacillota bacterium]